MKIGLYFERISEAIFKSDEYFSHLEYYSL
jgi:hypothetical protein